MESKYLFWFENEDSDEDFTFQIVAKDYIDAYNKAYNNYGPQVYDMLYCKIS